MKKFLITTLLLLQTACTSYQYIEPTDEKGKICTKACLDKQWDCMRDCNKNHSTCLAANNIQINLGTTGVQDNKSNACYNAKIDCEYNCKNYYHQCYKSCGGVIIEK
jgi:hypothetical protein